MIISCILQQARIKNKAKTFRKLFNPLSPFVGYENQFFCKGVILINYFAIVNKQL